MHVFVNVLPMRHERIQSRHVVRAMNINFITTGFRRRRSGGFWHLLVAWHWHRWRMDFVTPQGKPGYRRLYIGPIEIEWSRT